MSRSLHYALLASAAVHAGAAAMVWESAPASPPPPLLVASLRMPPAPASMPMPVARPMPEKQSKPARQQAAQPVLADAGQTAAPAATPTAPIAATESPAASAAPLVSPGPASLEPPRYEAAYLANPAPPYPVSAKRRGIEGTAQLEARIGRSGEAQEVKLAVSAGDTALDEAALAAVRAWRFVPARRGSEAVEAWVRIPVVFRLN